MAGFLQVNDTAATLPSTPTNLYLADEVASICPLLTPSPPTNDLINPQPENEENSYELGDELSNKLQQVKENHKCDADSASSSSSALAEPSCTQLLGHRNNYHHHVVKDEESVAQETNGKAQPLQLTFRNPPDYFFMTWNWPVIRKLSRWTFMACLVAMLASVIAMIATLPRKCNPEVEWYQGTVFYEIFPASFADTNNGMTGDLNGIARHANYIKELGVGVVRLNSIFESPRYPEDYRNITNLIDIAKPLGDIRDFERMMKHLESRNISVVLDLPIGAIIEKKGVQKPVDKIKNDTASNVAFEYFKSTVDDHIQEALLYWCNYGVKGFYLKGMENIVGDPELGKALSLWRKTIGFDRIFIISEEALNRAHTSVKNSLLNNVNLVDVLLNIDRGVTRITRQIDDIDNSTLFSAPGMPWIHWSIGDENTKRLANRLHFGNGTLGALLLHLMLPGSPSIFYGDEIELQQVLDPNGERTDLSHVHHFSPMIWPEDKDQKVLSWNHGEKTPINFVQTELLAKMINLRSESPSIYMNAVIKEGGIKANAQVKYSGGDLLVIQRWYPRRKSYVVVSNLGKKFVTADLSRLLYTGEVVVGPRPDSLPGSLSFKEVSLWPGESVVVVLH